MPRRDGLTRKQARFCAEYMADLNATQAAIRAGYSPASARAIATELLRNPHVMAEVQALEAAQLKRAGITADGVLDGLRRVAFFDVATIYEWVQFQRTFKNPNELKGQPYKCGCIIGEETEESLGKGCIVHGPETGIVLPLTAAVRERRLKHPADWPPDARLALAGFDTVVRNLTAGDGLIDTVLKVKLNDRMQALATLAQHHGLLVAREEVNKTLTIRWLPPEPPPGQPSIDADSATGPPHRFIEGQVDDDSGPKGRDFELGPPAPTDRPGPPVVSDPGVPGMDELENLIAGSGLSRKAQERLFPELRLSQPRREDDY